MGILTVVLAAIAGAALLNGMPHFVAGTAGLTFRSPFGRYSSPRTNVVWGLANFTLAVAIVFVTLAVAAPTAVDVVWFLVGALVMIAFFGLRARQFFDDRGTLVGQEPER